MGNFDFSAVDKKWQKFWKENNTFAAENQSQKPKYYVLDMFPYPSGAGLHVGHPLGYIATDIVARYKWQNGFNVMHPMGFDAFGLPAEQYAIQTGTHPAVTTERNIRRFLEQCEMMGLAYDPSSSKVITSVPDYYKWTQWIFLKLFNSWYNRKSGKAEPLETLLEEFNRSGNEQINAACGNVPLFSVNDWKQMDEKQKHAIALEYRLAYITTGTVNWCQELGTVLSNDEVVNGVSERGGHAVERIAMRQWVMRMTAYADRLLEGLDRIQWPEPLKEMQRNWIGRSTGAEINFSIEGTDEKLTVFTTRPDTIFGVSFMVLAPEHELLDRICSKEKRDEVRIYSSAAKNRSDIERMADQKSVSGIWTGAFAIHPFTQKKIPIWTADYVLAGYGTGAIMAVPAGDARDHRFAKHFDLPVPAIFEGMNASEQAFEEKGNTTYINSEFLNGLSVTDGIQKAIEKLETGGMGSSKVNFKLRDPNFSRQRYWGEPFPVVFRDGMPYGLPEKDLPVVLPDVENYQPTGAGEGPLASVPDWVRIAGEGTRETHTMPGYAGSSWYFLRYLDPQNEKEFCTRGKSDYWMNVDLYVGGSEHAVGHLLYSRFWTKVLFDLGFIKHDEPFQKLVNQGMIQGRSSIAHRVKGKNKFVSLNLSHSYETDPIRVHISLVENDVLDISKFRGWREEFLESEFILEDGQFICGYEIEKMSKRYHNVTNPDDICTKYGADTFRCYEMFLGPLEVSKPWLTNGIEGVSRFLRKLHNLFSDSGDNWIVTEEEPSAEELKILHQTIRKTGEDIEKLSFNTAIAQFMIFTNEMTRLGCRKRKILEPFLRVFAPFAPHFAEEMRERIGQKGSISKSPWPSWEEKYLVESSFEYPVQLNGKMKGKLKLPLDLTKEQIEKEVIESKDVLKMLGGQALRKVIVVPGRVINLVV